MRSIIWRLLVTAVLISAGLAGQAAAGGVMIQRETAVKPPPKIWTYRAPHGEPPFARSARSQKVWDAGACWSECGAYCAWAMAGCLESTPQGTCLVYTDACDRYCQVSCRKPLAGPFIPIE